MDKKNDKKEVAKEVLKVIDELEDTVRLENIVKDNKIEFEAKGKKYRVRRSIAVEDEELSSVRRKKYTEMVSDDSFFFRKQWIEKYKKKGIDIKQMEQDIRTMNGEIKGFLLRLAKTTDIDSVGKLKDEILKLRDEQKVKVIERTDLLGYSIEDQLNMFSTEYTCYLVLERKEGDKWVKVFKTFEEFDKSENSELVSKSLYYVNYLIYEI